MDELLLALKTWQANSVVLYSTSHGFHWNVEGALFTQYHNFFEEIYTDVYGSIDTIAEWQRKFNSPAPFTLREFTEYNTYGDIVSSSNSPLIMSQILLLMIEKMIIDVKDIFDLATRSREQGLANFAADRQDKLEFWAWWLRSSIKSTTVTQ
jgi:starvation-inducible DNA-binding protein